MTDIDKHNKALQSIVWTHKHGFPMIDRSRPTTLPKFDGAVCAHRWVDRGEGTCCADCGELPRKPEV